MLRQQAMNRRVSRTDSSARNFELNPALEGDPNVRLGHLQAFPASQTMSALPESRQSRIYEYKP